MSTQRCFKALYVFHYHDIHHKMCHDNWYTDVKFSLSAHSSLWASLSVKVMSGTMFTRQPVTRGCVRCVSFALYLEQLQRRNVECWDSAEWGERSGLTPIKRDFDRGVYGSKKKGEGSQEKSKQRERVIASGRKQINFNRVCVCFFYWHHFFVSRVCCLFLKSLFVLHTVRGGLTQCNTTTESACVDYRQP